MTPIGGRSAPCCVEVVGAAGAGKSTLVGALLTRHPDWVKADELHTRAVRQWPYIARGLPGAWPILCNGLRPAPRLSWEEAKFVLYAETWDRFVTTHSADDTGVTILDQGVLFALARLEHGKANVSTTDRYRAWAARQVDRWAGVLDAVIWLDAPDDVLQQRIDCREQAHALKDQSADTAAFLRSYRDAYGRLVDQLAASRPSTVIARFDTSLVTTDELVAEVEALIEDVRRREMTTR